MSSSLVEHIDEDEGNEYPFPRMPQAEPPFIASGGSSSSDVTPPYLARTLPTQDSSNSSSSGRRYRRHDRHSREVDEDSHDLSAKLLSRLVSRIDQRDVKHIRALLVVTNDRLEVEKRRADKAEQRAVETLHRLRSAHEATSLAQADAARARQEVLLYKMRFEQAERELARGQDMLDQLEQARKDAEEEAARSRNVARKCREQLVYSKAREEGRKEGYEEGLARGRAMALTENRGETVARKHSTNRWPAPRPSPSANRMVVDNEDEDESESTSTSPRYVPPAPVLQVPPDPPRPRPVAGPSAPRATPQAREARARRSGRTTPGEWYRASDTAPIASMLPMPTLVTPLNAPSPSHTRPSPPQRKPALYEYPVSSSPRKPPQPLSPQPIPVPPPGHAADPPPIPIHNAIPSPRHPPMDIPLDGWIPYAEGNDASSIRVPPPHELSRPATPVDLSKPPEPMDQDEQLERSPVLPVPPPPEVHSRPGSMAPENNILYPTASQARDYAHHEGPFPMKAPSTMMASPQSQSRPSTLGQYDILAPPHQEKVYHQGVDRDGLIAGQGLPSARVIPPPMAQSVSGEDGQNRWEKIFTERFKSRRSPRKDKGKERELVPDIHVESPTTPNSSSVEQTQAMTVEPHLLSPEHAEQNLPIPTVMRNPMPVPPKDSSSQSVRSSSRHYVGPSHRSMTPASMIYSPSHYAEAPMPTGVVYPAPPGRPKSRTSTRTGTSHHTSYAPSLTGSQLPVTLSPLSLGRPFQSFEIEK